MARTPRIQFPGAIFLANASSSLNVRRSSGLVAVWAMRKSFVISPSPSGFFLMSQAGRCRIGRMRCASRLYPTGVPAMRRIACLLVIIATPLLCGCACTANDILFELLSGSYTAEAHDLESRRSHFRSRVEAWKEYERLGP